ncbi:MULTISPECIES: hypothetical protein [Clostridium]|uniref:hypothetical protein n=1 Tax=Clostridium TaxID=1485 RepID=UPI000DFC664B|nr:hypothetical protein [Clostridium sporogenes]MCW6085566.1 hypothetical protein [Clostridium sporogenes]STC76616.1 Uncharacterised protein [Clostridium botulinum]
MGLFNKKEEMFESYLKDNNLNDLDTNDKKMIENIMDEYLSDKLLKIGAVFSTENLECLKMQQNDILIKQNWLIIKKLNELLNK